MLAAGLMISMLAAGLMISMLAEGLMISMLAEGLMISMLAEGEWELNSLSEETDGVMDCMLAEADGGRVPCSWLLHTVGHDVGDVVPRVPVQSLLQSLLVQVVAWGQRETAQHCPTQPCSVLDRAPIYESLPWRSGTHINSPNY